MSGRLVRYGGVRAISAFRRTGYGRAVRAVAFARRAAPFVRTAMRGYRRFKRGRTRATNRGNKRRVRQRIGERPGTSSAKRAGITDDRTIATRTLYDVQLLNLGKGQNIDNRERNVVNFRGVKCCLSFVNKAATVNGQHLYVNYAVVTPKASDDKIGIDMANFFRGTGVDRGVDFGIGLSALEFRCLNINTDKWDILKHKRIQLAPYSSNEGANCRTSEFYLPVNRQIRYQTDGQLPVAKQLFLIYWCDYQDTPATTAAANNVCDVQLRVVKYFKEPANCC